MSAPQPGPWDLPAAGAHIHLVGIAGAGMRGLGLLLDAAGYRISGCDLSGVDDLVELNGRGTLASGHDPSHVEGADLVIHTSAAPAEHPELQEAARLGVPTMKRSRALAEGIAGSKVVLFERNGHALVAEDPEGLARVCKQFLEGIA